VFPVILGLTLASSAGLSMISAAIIVIVAVVLYYMVIRTVGRAHEL
jgi:hypothetical protein